MRILKCERAWLCLFLGLFFRMAEAQDLHCSQFWMNAMRINPATTGLIEGQIRAGLYSRTQWISVTKPYQTNGVWVEAPVWKRKVYQDIFGAGLSVDRDQAGDSKYRTWQMYGYFSYSKSLNYRNNHFLSIGASAGLSQRQFNVSDLTTDEQFQGGIFNPEIPSGEVYPQTSFFYPDLGVGVRWFYKPNLCAFDAGLSLWHLNRPPQSMLKDPNIRLPMKYTAQFQLHFPIAATFSLTPALYYSRQQRYNEVMFGFLASYLYRVDPRGDGRRCFFGLDYRVLDAIYLVTGLQWKQFRLQMSYDFNVSALSKASHGRGGFELSAVYLYKRPYSQHYYKMPCPIF